jgi:hypothetical protein
MFSFTEPLTRDPIKSDLLPNVEILDLVHPNLLFYVIGYIARVASFTRVAPKRCLVNSACGPGAGMNHDLPSTSKPLQNQNELKAKISRHQRDNAMCTFIKSSLYIGGSIPPFMMMLL